MKLKEITYEKFIITFCVVVFVGIIGYQMRQDYLRDPGFRMPSMFRGGN